MSLPINFAQNQTDPVSQYIYGRTSPAPSQYSSNPAAMAAMHGGNNTNNWWDIDPNSDAGKYIGTQFQQATGNNSSTSDLINHHWTLLDPNNQQSLAQARRQAVNPNEIFKLPNGMYAMADTNINPNDQHGTGWSPTRIRDSVESVAAEVLNYYFPGSIMLTSQLTSRGSQAQLGSTWGQLASLGTGAAGSIGGTGSNWSTVNPVSDNFGNFGNLTSGSFSGGIGQVGNYYSNNPLSGIRQGLNLANIANGPAGPQQRTSSGGGGQSQGGGGVPVPFNLQRQDDPYGYNDNTNSNGGSFLDSLGNSLGNINLGDLGNLLTTGGRTLADNRTINNATGAINHATDLGIPFSLQDRQAASDRLRGLTNGSINASSDPAFQAALGLKNDNLTRTMAAHGMNLSGNEIGALSQQDLAAFNDWRQKEIANSMQTSGANFDPSSTANTNMRMQQLLAEMQTRRNATTAAGLSSTGANSPIGNIIRSILGPNASSSNIAGLLSRLTGRNSNGDFGGPNPDEVGNGGVMTGPNGEIIPSINPDPTNSDIPDMPDIPDTSGGGWQDFFGNE